MARGKKPRRVPSKAELALANPVWLATKHAPMNEEQRAQLIVAAHMAYIRIGRGDPQPDDPDTLAVAVNVSYVLCEWGLGAEHMPLVRAAQDALMRAAARRENGLPFNFDGPGRTAWEEFMELSEAHLEAAGHVQVMRALLDVDARIKAGRVLFVEK